MASSSSFFSTPVLVGGILGIVFLEGIVACFCRWKCKNHSMAPPHDTQIPVSLEMGNLATSVDESLVFDDLEVSSAPCLVSSELSAPCLGKFPGAGQLREQLAQDSDQHAGPGQVQTNQALYRFSMYIQKAWFQRVRRVYSEPSKQNQRSNCCN